MAEDIFTIIVRDGDHLRVTWPDLNPIEAMLVTSEPGRDGSPPRAMARFIGVNGYLEEMPLADFADHVKDCWRAHEEPFRGQDIAPAKSRGGEKPWATVCPRCRSWMGLTADQYHGKARVVCPVKRCGYMFKADLSKMYKEPKDEGSNQRDAGRH